MTSALQRLPDETIELSITIPWADIAKLYEQAIATAVQNAELPGFRKGKAPRMAVEEKLDKTKVYEEVLKDMLPKAYNEAITQQKIRPVVTPKVELKEANEGKDWIVCALTCEKPAVTLGEYKKAIQNVKAAKQKKIWVPGKDDPKQEEPKDQKPTLDDLLKAVYENITVKIPGLLLEHEVNRLLSDLIDQTKKLGLTVEQYLASTNRSPESIKKEYEEQARRTLALEFALEEIADKEGILISDDDIAQVIKTAKTDEEKKSLEGQKYYLASLLRRQKTLDFLAALYY